LKNDLDELLVLAGKEAQRLLRQITAETLIIKDARWMDIQYFFPLVFTHHEACGADF